MDTHIYPGLYQIGRFLLTEKFGAAILLHPTSFERKESSKTWSRKRFRPREPLETLKQVPVGRAEEELGSNGSSHPLTSALLPTPYPSSLFPLRPIFD